MKKLDFDQMQKIEGGISCASVQGVFDYLHAAGYHDQAYALSFNGNSLMCYRSDGAYVNYWD